MLYWYNWQSGTIARSRLDYSPRKCIYIPSSKEVTSINCGEKNWYAGYSLKRKFTVNLLSNFIQIELVGLCRYIEKFRIFLTKRSLNFRIQYFHFRLKRIVNYSRFNTLFYVAAKFFFARRLLYEGKTSALYKMFAVTSALCIQYFQFHRTRIINRCSLKIASPFLWTALYYIIFPSPGVFPMEEKLKLSDIALHRSHQNISKMKVFWRQSLRRGVLLGQIIEILYTPKDIFGR